MGTRAVARSRAGGQRGATTQPQRQHCSPGPAGPPPVLQPPGAGVPTQLPQQPPPLLPFLSCAHQALGEVFFFLVPTRHSHYLQELTTPHHISISTSSQVGPGASMRFVVHGGGTGHRGTRARALGQRVQLGGACAYARGHLMALTCPGSEGSPRFPLRAVSRPSAGTFLPVCGEGRKP